MDIATQVTSELEWDKNAFEYVGQVSWSRSGLHLAVFNRAQTESIGFTLKDNKLVELYRGKDSAWLDADNGFPAIKSEGNAFSIQDAQNLAGIEPHLLLDLTEKDFTIAHYNNPWELQISKFGFDGGALEISRADGYAGGVVDDEYAVVIQHALDLPQAKYLVKRQGETIFEIESFAENSSVIAKPIIESVTDRKLPTAVLFPEGHQIGSHKLPVVVAIYGGPHHSEVIAAVPTYAADQWLANQGYAVVVIDNAGTPGKGAAWEREVKNDLTEIILSDQVKALNALFEKYPDLDSSRVGIHGWSFGGYLSALAVLDRPDVYHAAWAGAPVTDWRLYDTAYTERYLGHPDVNKSSYENQSLIGKAHKLSRPLTLIHGLADDNVLAAHSLQLSGALLAAGKPHNFIPLAGVSHMTPQVDITKNLMLLMRDFFDANL